MKNKLLHFALDLFSASDDEEQDSIFAQVKIYRTASVRIFEYIIGILLLAIWLLIIRNIIHAAAENGTLTLSSPSSAQSALVSASVTAIIHRPTICHSSR